MKLSSIIKFLAWTVVAIIGLVVLLLLAVNLPPVQNWLTGKAVNYLREQTNTTIEVDNINLRLPRSVLLEGVYVEDRQEDTLLYAGKIRVGFSLAQLLNQTFTITGVTLEDINAQLHPVSDSTMNYQFLLDSLSGSSSAQAPPPDTTQSGSGWGVAFSNAEINLNNIRLYYLQPDSALEMSLKLGSFVADSRAIDLQEGKIDLENIALRQSKMEMRLGESEEPADTTTSPLNYSIQAGELIIEEVDYVLTMPDLELSAGVGFTKSEDLDVLLQGDTMSVESPAFDLSQSSFRYDIPSAEPVSGFDYNHIDLDSIEIHLRDFDYFNLDIKSQVQGISAVTDKGTALRKLQGYIHYTPDSIRLEDLEAATNRSEIVAPTAFITIPSSGGAADSLALEEMELRIDLERAAIHPEDVLFFVPALGESPVFQQQFNQRFVLRAQMAGTLADLEVSRFEVRGWNSRLTAEGHMQHLINTDQLALDIRLPVININREALDTWLPPGTLPDSIQLPQTVSGNLALDGTAQEMNFIVDLQTSRTVNTIATRLRAGGVAERIMTPDRLGYVVQIDTLYTTRGEIMGLLPPQTLPANTRLPDDILVQGTIRGTMDTVSTDLELLLRRDTSESRLFVSGGIDQFQNPDSAFFDFQVDSIDLKPEMISSFLPDSVLPEYLRFPAIQSGSITLRGTMTDLRAGLTLQTDIGRITTEGNLQDSTYSLQASLENIDPEILFEPAAYDSIVGRDLSPFTIDLNIEGAGFDPDSNLVAQVDLRLLPENDSLHWDTGIVLNGRVRGKNFIGTIRADEPGLQAVLDAEVGMNADSVLQTALKLDLEELNLKKLNLKDTIFVANGRLQAETTGSNLNNFQGQIAIRSFDLLYDTVRAHVDSLLLDANFQPDTNSVVLRSDVARGFLRGKFEFPDIVQRIEGYLQSYIDPTYQDSLQLDTTYASFEMELELERSNIFTSGIIPNLQEISPSSISASFNSGRELLTVEAEIPHVKYAGIALDSVVADARLGAEVFEYDIGFAEMLAFNEIRTSHLSLSGTEEGERFVNRLRQIDRGDSIRFNIVVEIIPEESGQVAIHFQPEALINYNEWQFSPDNRILTGGDTLSIDSWQLSRNGSILDLSDREGDDLVAEFRQFNLRVLSNTIKYQSDYLSGTLNGTVAMENFVEQPTLAADIRIDTFGVLGAGLGNLTATAEQGAEGSWEGKLDFSGEGHDFNIVAGYFPGEDTTGIRLTLDAQRIDLAQLEPLALGSLEDVEGALTGNMDIGGTLEQPTFNGQLQFESAALRVAQLQALWKIGDQPITFRQIERQGKMVPVVRLNRLTIEDKDGDTFTLNGSITTSEFDQFNLFLSMSAKSFLVLNSTEEDNDLFYGKLEVDATGFLGGTLDSAAISLNVEPTGDNRVVYVMPTGALQTVETGEGVIEFVAPDTLTQIALENQREATEAESSPFGWSITLNTSINEALQLKIVTNPLNNDNFQGKADGNLALQIAPNGEMELSGRVEIVEGTYLFTYSELIKRKFEVLEESYIQWTGDVMDPELFVRAQYTTKASPAPIMPIAGDNTPPAYKQRQEFQAVFVVSGTLEDMEVSTEIQYPETPLNTNNSEIRAAIEEINQDPSNSNSQAFSLLLFNGFMSPNMAGGSDMQLINVDQSLNDLLTSYLNNFANQYIGFVDINFDIESNGQGSGGYFESTDFRVSLQKTFLDNRLTVSVDGVASNRQTSATSNTNEMQTYLDNITVEYALTQEGVLNIRLYNRRENNDFYGGEVVKMGAALGFSKDFQKLRIFSGNKKNRKDDPEQSPEQEPASPLPRKETTGTDENDTNK